eukprot:13812602-Alexandrium_andersonii.AAC.1
MSASLVGSEMCIRDRLCALLDVARPLAPGFKCQAYGRDVLSPIHPVEPAVSYTHLTLPTICSV